MLAHDRTAYLLLDHPNDCWDYLSDLISTTINNTCPVRTRVVRCKNEPWINNEILDLIFEKKQAWRRAKRTKNPDDITHAKLLRNQTKYVIRRAKSSYVQDYLENDTIAPKKFWEKINYILPTKTASDKINLIDRDTMKHINDNDVADYVNTFFANVGINLAQKFDAEWVDGIALFSEIAMEDLSVDEDTLLSIIQKIDIYKSSSICNISTRVLKDAFLVTVPQLVHLSLSKCIFPDSWKIANIIPLQKPGDRSDVNNLRPISLLPLPGKMLERIVHTQLSTFLEANNILSDKQGGFRKGRSTISTIAAYTDDILLGIKDKQYTLILRKRSLLLITKSF